MRRLVMTRHGIPGLIAATLAIASIATLLSCSTGTPAAPEGTRIAVNYEYIPGTRNLTTGDFEARIFVHVMDNTSNVPHVGVGVFFQVESGPGRFTETDRVVTTDDGYAENILIASGAVEGNAVVISAFSGEVTSPTLTLDVMNGSSEENFAPVASFTTAPNNPTTSLDVTVDVSASTDADCPGGKPTRYEVDWDDGTAITAQAFTTPTASHRYTAARTYTIEVRVIDCDGLSDTATKSITVS